jgi:hypothetical protein
MTFLLFILRRARRHWPIMFTLSLGVVLTTALLASGPLLVDAVVEMGLRLTFSSSSVADGNLRLTTSSQSNRASSQALDGEIRTLLQATMGKHLDRVVRSTESIKLFPWVDGQAATEQRVNLRFYEGLQDHVEYVGGEWPGETSDEPIDVAQGRLNVIRAVVSDGMARSFVLRVGDRLPLSYQARSTEPDVWIEVTGIVRPQNPRDPYWFGEFDPLTVQNNQHSVILPEDALFPAVASLFPGDNVALAWHVLLRHDSFSVADIEPFQAQLAELNAELEIFQPRMTLHTGAPDILATFQNQLESIRAPLYILVAEVMLLVLYYVTMVATLSMRQVERELAILRSRGTLSW